METFLTPEFNLAYCELMLGVAGLRLASVQHALDAGVDNVIINSSYPSEAIILRIPAIIGKIVQQGPVPRTNTEENALIQLNSMFVVTLWAKLTETRAYNAIADKPIIQFMRHVRNACAHDNLFNFKSLKKTARWRNKEITLKEAGTTLFPNFLKDGDIILLVIDINQAFFIPLTIPAAP